MELPLSNRIRKYGYIYWLRQDDDNLKKLLGERNEIDVFLNRVCLGTKKIDWKFRRVSIGCTATRNIPVNCQTVKLELSEDNLILNFK